MATKKGVTKKFNNKLHKKFDPFGRAVAKEFLTKFDFDIKDNPNKFGIDLLVVSRKTGEHISGIEVEVSDIWKPVHFPYQYLNVPHRKAEFFEQDEKSLYIMCNHYGNSIAVITGKTILNSPVEVRWTKYSKDEDEYFFIVDTAKVKFIDIRDKDKPVEYIKTDYVKTVVTDETVNSRKNINIATNARNKFTDVFGT